MASKLVIIVVLILGIVALGLAVNAERRRNTAKIISDRELKYKYCQYDSDTATTYGLGAFFCLLASQILVMAVSRCLCCGKPLNPGGSRACAITLFIFCWLSFIIAEVCLLAGSARNAYHTSYKGFYVERAPSCATLRKGVFAAGAAFAFFTTFFSVFYYISYSKARR